MCGVLGLTAIYFTRQIFLIFNKFDVWDNIIPAQATEMCLR